MCFPTWETHFPSDMCSPTQEQMLLVICVALPWKHIYLVICVLEPEKHISHIPCVICFSTWKTHTPSDMCLLPRNRCHIVICVILGGTDIFSGMCFPIWEQISQVICFFFLYPRSTYPKQNGFPVSGNTFV